MCSLKKFKGNLMIIMCEMWIHIPLQTQHATSTKARILIILDHEGRWCILYHDNYNRQSSCQVSGITPHWVLRCQKQDDQE